VSNPAKAVLIADISFDNDSFHVSALMLEAIDISETSSTSTTLHGALFQKAVIFIFAAMRTLNITFLLIIYNYPLQKIKKMSELNRGAGNWFLTVP
jgi:hypothetical protein